MPLTVSRALTLARISNLPTVWTNVLAAWWLAGGGLSWRLAAVMLAGSLVYAGGCTLNDAFDAAWDRRNRPERPIPSGALAAGTVWTLGLSELLGGLAVFLAAGSRWPWIPVLLVAAVLAYDWRHKDRPWSVFVMGACRWLLYAAAGAAAFPESAVRFLAAGGVMFGYIAGLSLVAKRESFPQRYPTAGQLVALMLAGIALVDAALVAAAGTGPGRFAVAAVCAALFPVCRLLQQKFAAT